MDFLRFLGRHVGASFFGAIGVLLAALGYADQAGKIMTGFEPWALQASGAALFVVAVVMVLYRYDQSQLKPLSPKTIVRPFRASPASAPPQTTVLKPEKPSPSSSDDRVFVGANVTAAFLTSLFDGKTTHQGSLAAKPFLGKWMKVTGEFADLHVMSDRLARVSLKRPPADPTLGLALYFRQQFERLEILQPGEVVTIVGQIDKVQAYQVELENCQLLSVVPSV